MNIISHIDERIGYIQINRPERKNALTSAMYQTMADTLKSYDTDNNVRVILLHGLIDMFCAGNDLQDFLQNPVTDNEAPVVQFLFALRDLQKPLVIAVNGVAVGVGVTMLLHADLVVVADDSKFQLPFINLALCPEAGSSLLLTQRAGYLRSAEKLMLGEFFNAQEALEMGITNRIMPHVEVLRYAQHQARHLAEKSPQAMRATKALLKSANTDALRSAMDAELLNFGQLLRGNDSREAMTAFFEKRPPNFQ
jgi:enoyl-CoA hydratase/carnithine racemase